jgi:hypothetical protein
MPNSITKQETDSYLIERTMYRPRDLIVFFNLCIREATDRPDITAQMVIHAEAEYSQKRLRSLYDEWHAQYPELEDCVKVLKHLPAQFRLDEISGTVIEEVCLAIATDNTKQHGPIHGWATQFIEEKLTSGEFRSRLAGVFYRTGILGLRIEKSTEVSWSFLHAATIPETAVREDTPACVCPMFFRALGINPAAGKK